MNIAFFTIQTVNPFIGGVERVTHNLTQYFESPNIKVYYFIYKVKRHYKIFCVNGKYGIQV